MINLFCGMKAVIIINLYLSFFIYVCYFYQSFEFEADMEKSDCIIILKDNFVCFCHSFFLHNVKTPAARIGPK